MVECQGCSAVEAQQPQLVTYSREASDDAGCQRPECDRYGPNMHVGSQATVLSSSCFHQTHTCCTYACCTAHAQALVPLQTLVSCTQAHLPKLGELEERQEPQAVAVGAQLHEAAQLLLPQLLCTYHATICEEDRACLLALKALDAVIVRHQPCSKHVSFLDHVGYLWAGLWKAASAQGASQEQALDDLLRCPDLVDPRFVLPAAPMHQWNACCCKVLPSGPGRRVPQYTVALCSVAYE